MDKQSSKSITPITKCFPTLSKAKTDNNIATTGNLMSPEYQKTMTGKRETRHSSKRQTDTPTGQEDLLDQSDEQDNLSSEQDPEVHNAVLPCPEQIDPQELFCKSYAEQMESVLTVVNQLCSKVIEVDISLNHDSDGINTRLQTTITQCDQNTTSNQSLQTELKDAQSTTCHLKDENIILKGIIHQQSTQLKALNSKVTYLTAKSMETNIIVSNIDGDIGTKEKCKDNVVTFLRAKVEIDVDHSEVYIARRLGQWHKNLKHPRSMLFRCKFTLKERIFTNIKNLSDKTNNAGHKYYVNKQLPEVLIEENREIRREVQKLKLKEQDLPNKDKSSIEVKNKVVHIDRQPIVKQIQQIEIEEYFPDSQEKEKQDKLKLTSSDIVTEQGSSFTAYTIKSGQIHEVRRAYRKIKRNHPGATHVIASFNIAGPPGQGYQDDGEHGAGYRLTQLLEDHYAQNTTVFVVRMYGGTHLGPKCFEAMKKVAKQALERAGVKKK